MKERKRIVVVSISVFFLFSLLILQYFKIQILDGEKWTGHALAQHELVVKEPFRRGTFYSNTSLKQGHPEKLQPLVADVTKFHLYIDPLSIPFDAREEIASTLSELIQECPEIRKELDRQTRNRRVATWLNRETKETILKWWGPYARKKKIARNALYFVTDYQRSYPFGKLLGQVLHTIREMKDEVTQEAIPTGGLEAYFNEYLKGKMGKRKLLRSPLNHLETDKVIEPPEDGADVYLTINHCIQAIVEEELEKGVHAASAKKGWAVMMDPHTGDILALAQYPFFTPANYRDFFNDPEKLEDAKVKAITDAFELGSIMKPITLAIGLKANAELAKEGKPPLFYPEGKIDTTRSVFPGRGSKPLKDPTLHRALNMFMALQRSSNVYMAQLIERVINTMGSQWYYKQLVDTFGFNKKTGIELPGEAIGMIPTPGKLYSNGALEWSTPTPYSLSIGYNLLATSLQMLRAYSIFANGGYLVQPTLVKSICKTGKEVVLIEKNDFPRVLDENICQEVVKALKYTTKPGGGGALAAINGYSEAGKTGTAEKNIGGVYSKQWHISSFIGFAPARVDFEIPPCFVLIVTIDEPAPILVDGGFKNFLGGRCAAPVFREIARRTLEYLGVSPDDPYGYQKGDPRFDEEKADWMKEVEKLKHLYQEWNH